MIDCVRVGGTLAGLHKELGVGTTNLIHCHHGFGTALHRDVQDIFSMTLIEIHSAHSNAIQLRVFHFRSSSSGVVREDGGGQGVASI
jgi:hypothetical protein